MFNEFKRDLAQASEDDRAARDRLAALDMARAEMTHFALIIADQDSLGRVDELSRTDYRAARERFDEAARAIQDARVERVAECQIRFLSHVHPSRLQLIEGGAS